MVGPIGYGIKPDRDLRYSPIPILGPLTGVALAGFAIKNLRDLRAVQQPGPSSASI